MSASKPSKDIDQVLCPLIISSRCNRSLLEPRQSVHLFLLRRLPAPGLVSGPPLSAPHSRRPHSLDPLGRLGSPGPGTSLFPLTRSTSPRSARTTSCVSGPPPPGPALAPSPRSPATSSAPDSTKPLAGLRTARISASRTPSTFPSPRFLTPRPASPPLSSFPAILSSPRPSSPAMPDSSALPASPPRCFATRRSRSTCWRSAATTDRSPSGETTSPGLSRLFAARRATASPTSPGAPTPRNSSSPRGRPAPRSSSVPRNWAARRWGAKKCARLWIRKGGR